MRFWCTPALDYGEEDLTKSSEAAVKRSEMVEIGGDLKSYSIPLTGKADK